MTGLAKVVGFGLSDTQRPWERLRGREAGSDEDARTPLGVTAEAARTARSARR